MTYFRCCHPVTEIVKIMPSAVICKKFVVFNSAFKDSVRLVRSSQRSQKSTSDSILPYFTCARNQLSCFATVLVVLVVSETKLTSVAFADFFISVYMKTRPFLWYWHHTLLSSFEQKGAAYCARAISPRACVVL